jgi:hypothetical protein
MKEIYGILVHSGIRTYAFHVEPDGVWVMHTFIRFPDRYKWNSSVLK